MVKCLIDGSEHHGINELHGHLRKLKITQKDYWEKYHPRADLLTGEKIEYKNYKQYSISDFINKDNLGKWCNLYPEKGVEWGKNYLKHRKKEKGLIRAPHHVELRSLYSPNVRYYEKYADYTTVCEELGFKIQFDYKQEVALAPLQKNTKIIIDTREQDALPLKNSYIDTLKFGDYALAGALDKGVRIERKNLNDFVGSFGKNIERLKREMQRAKEAGGYLIVLVEKDIKKALAFDDQYETRYTKVSPDHVFKNVRDCLAEFDNLQFLFVDGRKEAARVLIKLFEMGEQVKTCDLEYYYEIGKL
jgi:hypothetical protein